MKILVLHGPNLNLFGRREPHIYGTTTLAEIDAQLAALAAELGVELETLQSNHEGALIDNLHENIDTAQGALVNPAGLTQHGVPLHDAIKAMPFPVLEVHMSQHRRARSLARALDHLAGGQGHDPGPGPALVHCRRCARWSRSLREASSRAR